MLQVKTKIFKPLPKRFSRFYILRNSFYFALVCLAISMAALALHFPTIFNFFTAAVFIFMLISKIWRGYTEPTYGRLAENLVITKDGIIFETVMYLFKDMQDFQIQLACFYDNSSPWHSGKGHMRGVDNTMFFIANDRVAREQFLISSGTEFAAIQSITDQAVCKEKLPFKHRYLDMVSDTYKQTEEYRLLIQKIKHKNHTFVP